MSQSTGTPRLWMCEQHYAAQSGQWRVDCYVYNACSDSEFFHNSFAYSNKRGIYRPISSVGRSNMHQMSPGVERAVGAARVWSERLGSSGIRLSHFVLALLDEEEGRPAVLIER